jgi:sigma-B regulation protein RsbQ
MASDVIRRNNVRVFGTGTQPMVFVHGFGCDQNMWRFLTPAFEQDYKIVLFDYVGAGKSDLSAYNPDRYSNLNGYAQDILEVCDALQLRNAVLVGHSVSSITCLIAAVKRPELFHSVIFVSPSPRYINDPPEYIGGFERKDIEELLATMDKNYIGWANFLAPMIMKNPDKPELTNELTGSFCSTDPKVARNFAQATFFSDNRADLPKLKVPSLILQCSEDLIAPVSVGQYMREHTPNSTLKLMKATGHCPHMSAPEETIQLMKEYLQTLQEAQRQ